MSIEKLLQAVYELDDSFYESFNELEDLYADVPTLNSFLSESHTVFFNDLVNIPVPVFDSGDTSWYEDICVNYVQQYKQAISDLEIINLIQFVYAFFMEYTTKYTDKKPQIFNEYISTFYKFDNKEFIV